MLKVINSKKTYKLATHQVDALKGLDFSLENGQLVAIVGPSGCGKTSLMNILGALDSDFTGDVVVNNKSMKEAQSKDIDTHRKNTVGFIFQHFTLINSLNGLENVELAFDISNVGKKEKRSKAMELLKQVGLEEHMYKKVNKLSGGQKQRVAIARALANNPDIILADEPTGALDYKTGIQVMEILKEIAKTRLVIMVTHSPELARDYANKIIVMKDGEIIDTIDNIEHQIATKPNTSQVKKSSMSIFTAFRLSYRNLWFKKGRTLWTSIGLSIGIIGIALAIALSTGTKTAIERQVLTIFPANTIAVTRQSEDSGIFSEPKAIRYSDIETIIGISDQITGYAFFPDSIMPGPASRDRKVADMETFREYRNKSDDAYFFITNIGLTSSFVGQINFGRLPNNESEQFEVMLSQSTAEKLIRENETVDQLINQTLYFSMRDFDSENPKVIEAKIVGISSENTMMDSITSDMDSLYAMLEREFGIKKETIESHMVSIFVDDVKNVDRLAKEFTEAQDEFLYQGLATSILSTVNNILDIVRNGLIAFSSVSVIVAVLMIAIVIYISVLERQREIGIIRAIGGRKKDIRNMFIGESLTIGLLSGIIGISVSYGLTYLINSVIHGFLTSTNPNAPRFNVADLQPLTALILIAICMLIAVISGLIPSLKAAKLDPVESIRKR